MHDWYQEATLELVARAEAKKGGQKGSQHQHQHQQQARMADEARHRSAELSTSSSSRGVSFAGRSVQGHYFRSKFARRGVLLYQLLWMLREEPVFQSRPAALSVVSIGGGPGTDASGFVWLRKRLLRDTAIDVHLCDKESTWKYYLETLRGLFAGDVASLSFDTCDSTVALDAAQNARTAVALAAADVVVFAYVCNETSELSRARGHCFYEGMAGVLKRDALLVFLDVLRESAAVLDGIVALLKRSRELQVLDCARFSSLRSEVRVVRILDDSPLSMGLSAGGDSQSIIFEDQQQC
ncbi:MAG: hypothetical protein Q8P67_01820 [archaeon]|nr:hypothetical protein [archaeon]